MPYAEQPPSPLLITLLGIYQALTFTEKNSLGAANAQSPPKQATSFKPEGEWFDCMALFAYLSTIAVNGMHLWGLAKRFHRNQHKASKTR